MEKEKNCNEKYERIEQPQKEQKQIELEKKTW